MTLVHLNPGRKRRRRRKGKSRSSKRSRAARKAWRTRRARGHVRGRRRSRKGRGRRTYRRSRRGSCRGVVRMRTRAAVRAERKRGNSRARRILSALAKCKGKPARETSSYGFTIPRWDYKHEGANPRRRRRRARNGASRFGYNRRRRARNYSNWIPAYKNSALSLSGATQAFKLGTITSTVPVISGFIGNQYLSGFLSGLRFMPGFMKSGIGSYVLGGLSAGLLAAGTGAIKPSLAPAVLLGGISEVMVKIVKRGIGMAFGKVSFLKGMNDYFHVGAPIAAAPGYGAPGRYMSDDLDGMNDYFNTSSPVTMFGMDSDAEELSGMDDFLDVGNVQNLPTIDALGNPIPPMVMMPEAVAAKELASKS